MSNVKVYLRIRPETNITSNNPESSLIYNDITSNRPKSLDPLMNNVNTIKITDCKTGKRCQVTSDKRHFNERHFDFEEIFEETSSQDDVYKVFRLKLLESALNGLNFCLMNYGQTSAGKTFTMFGEPDSKREGLVLRFIRELFQKLNEDYEDDPEKYLVKCSFFEIYKEKIIDLSVDNEIETNLQIRENVEKETYIDGLNYEIFNSSSELIDKLSRSLSKRRINETAMNDRSSRSHFVLTLQIESRTQIECPGKEEKVEIEVMKKSKLVFVDLAGSERQIHNNINVIQEGCSINKSLSVLQHVITSLAKKSQNKEFVHFRDSK
mgnify:CR=1 FL=1